MRHIWVIGWVIACSGPTKDGVNPVPDVVDEPPTDVPRTPVEVTVATFNVSMYRSRAGELIEDLSDGELEQARLAAAILQEVRPDIVLLNEFDHDAAGDAARLFHDGFLAVGQQGREPQLPVPLHGTGQHRRPLGTRP